MILIIKRADFSGKNLGKISVPLILEDHVKNIIKILDPSMTDNKKRSLNTFYNTLVSNKIWDKIDYLFIPFLCSDVSKSMINIKTLKTIYTPSSQYYRIIQNGLSLKEEYNSGNMMYNDIDCISFLIPNNINTTNAHFLVVNGYKEFNQFSVTPTGGVDFLGYGDNPGYRELAIKFNGFRVYSSKYLAEQINEEWNPVVLFSINDGYPIKCISGQIAEVASRVETSNTTSSRWYLLKMWDNVLQNTTNFSMSVFSLGEGLDQEQCKIYMEAVNKLTKDFEA